MPDPTAARITTVSRVYLIMVLFVALILCLVLLIQVQMDALTAIRAYVGGEGLWAKAQKEAMHSLEHYATSHDEADYLAFRRQIQVPFGDHMVRIELQKDHPDLAVARAGFLQGRNHPDDFAAVSRFFRRFQHTAYMTQVIGHWTAADHLVADLYEAAEALHAEILSGRNNPETIRASLIRLDEMNRAVTVEEDLFSSTLAAASRWANAVTRNLTYLIALLLVTTGVGLSWPIISRIRRTEDALLAAQEELVRNGKLAVLGQVAGSVGHELRNPLGVMSNAVYFLQTVLADADDSVKEYLNIIKDEIAGSDRIVSDLLDSVRTKAPHPETVGVSELIAQVLRKCSVPPGVTVRLEIPPGLPPLRVDAQQINQVFRNLISNGIEAMPEGGRLEISASGGRQNKHIRISVRDSGIGMGAAQREKLFQPLFTTKARGIGLGLVVVKNLTLANGGQIEVQSESGQGAMFTVTLPGEYEEVSQHV